MIVSLVGDYVFFQMENKLIFELEQQLNHLDVESNQLDAVIQLKTWQKEMFALVEKIYLNRLNEIDTMAANIMDEIKDKQSQLRQIPVNDRSTVLKLQNEIDRLQTDIIIEQNIPESFEHLIEQTIRVQHDDDDDDFVIIDIDGEKKEKTGEQIIVVLAPPSGSTNTENRVTKILNSEPVQQALAADLAKTLTHMGTVAITSSTTIAATTMAKTALLTTACGLSTMAYGMGRIALGTTQKVWSFVLSSEH